MKFLVQTFLAMSLLLSAPMAMAEHHKKVETEVSEVGISVGAAIPAVNGVLLPSIGADSAATQFDDLKGENGVVVAFVRSADWCPYCKQQLIELESVASELSSKGYPLVALSFDAPEKLAKFKAKQDLSFALVSDTASANIKAFGLLNEKYDEGSRMYGIPHPAVYVIGADGIVKAKLMEEGFKVRPAPEAILSAIDSIEG